MLFCYRQGQLILGSRGHNQKIGILFKGFWLPGLLKLYIYSGGAAKCCSGHWMRENKSWLQQAYLVAWYNKTVSYFCQCLGLCRHLEILWEGSCNYFSFFFFSSTMSPGLAFSLNFSHFLGMRQSFIEIHLILNRFLKARSDKLNQLVWSPIFGRGHKISISYNPVKPVWSQVWQKHVGFLKLESESALKN